MLKHCSSPTRNPRPKLVKVKVNLAFRMFLVIVIGVWMVYQLRLFLTHKLQPTQNGRLLNHADGAQQRPKLDSLGRRGLITADDGRIMTVKTEDEGKSEDKGAQVKDEDALEQLDEDEEMEIMDPLDDSLGENDLQNDDDEGDDDDQNGNSTEMKTEGADAVADDDESSMRMDKDAVNA